MNAAIRQNLPVDPGEALDKRFLLIAGPSGAGKSTFIRALAEGRLDPRIVAALPQGCAGWPVIEANNMLKDRLNAFELMAVSGVTSKAILHYDITFIHRFAIDDYANDPFCTLLRDVPQLDIIFVRPNLAVLLKQYDDRREQWRNSKSRSRNAWARWVRQPLKHAALRRQGLPTLAAHDLYRSPGFLGTCYRRWEEFLGQLTAFIPQSKMLVVRPEMNPSGEPSFVLERSAGRGAPISDMNVL
jgi:hypothetical protein